MINRQLPRSLDISAHEHDRLTAEVARLRYIVRGLLRCPEIAECAPEDKDPETDALERAARAELSGETT